jgi:uncharacterized protein YndB with AHSA1/START domain
MSLKILLSIFFLPLCFLGLDIYIVSVYRPLCQQKALINQSLQIKPKHMETPTKEKITVEATIKAPVAKVWKLWSEPKHIKNWSYASDDWHTPRAENDLRVGGSFTSRMEAKDGSFGFDFGGVYDHVRPNEYLAYTLGDGRRVEISFSGQGNETRVTETFEAENTHPIEMQKDGWQAILDNFKSYTETHTG